MDEIDIAQERAQQYTDEAVAARRRGVEGVWDGVERECADCGEPIPAARLRLVPGAVLCIECQRDREGVRGHAHLRR